MNSLEIHRASTQTETIVYAPYAWAANGSNTAGRYKTIAERTGFDIAVGHAPGTGRVIIDKATRRSLRLFNLGDFIDMADSHAEAVTEAIGGYAVRIGLGDSARGAW